MNIVLLTQNDPFYLGRNIDYLLNNMPKHSKVVGCVLFEVSPFGKRESFLDKAKKTLDIFGAAFFFRYATKYVWSKLFRKWQVKNVLQRHGVPLIQIQGNVNAEDSLLTISAYKPDILVSIAGNQIFKKPLIELASKACINLHTALLPKYRGLMPTFWVMKNSEAETGVSVFLVDEGIDSGPILVQEKVTIGSLTQEQLICLTKHIGMRAILKAIDLIYQGGYTLIENDASKQTYFSFPTREDVKSFLDAGKRFF